MVGARMMVDWMYGGGCEVDMIGGCLFRNTVNWPSMFIIGYYQSPSKGVGSAFQSGRSK